MKACEQCHRLFDDDAGFCPHDGMRLSPTDELALPHDPEEPRIGRSLCGGRYQIWRVVANGGMGRVYQALDLVRPRDVALKVLHAETAADPVAVERFRREYALSAQLPHDHIAEVFDFQPTEDESYALVMEYLEGEELRAMLKREKLMSPGRLVRILAQLAVGLDEPHRRCIVHRDIKPDNVFLCGTPVGPLVKLLDFGSVRDNTEGAKKLTMIGTTIGSPYYMSPEQAQGLESLDHRADVWSLGAIAYEALTGKLPFKGKTGPAILLSILGHEPAPPSIVGEGLGIPEEVDDVIADALIKDMAARIGSVAELADRFGQAYGLSGTHRAWASTPEAELEQAIAASARARSLAARPVPPQPAPAEAAPTGPQPTPSPPPPVDRFADDDDFVMGLPSGPPKALLAAAVGAAIVVAIVVAVLLFLR